MKCKYGAGFVDVEIGDIIEIKGNKGKLYDIRFIQQVRDNLDYFEFTLDGVNWYPREDVKVIKRIDKGDKNGAR